MTVVPIPPPETTEQEEKDAVHRFTAARAALAALVATVELYVGGELAHGSSSLLSKRGWGLRMEREDQAACLKERAAFAYCPPVTLGQGDDEIESKVMQLVEETRDKFVTARSKITQRRAKLPIRAPEERVA